MELFVCLAYYLRSLFLWYQFVYKLDPSLILKLYLGCIFVFSAMKLINSVESFKNIVVFVRQVAALYP